jgi:hypothetical protein
MVFMVFMIWVLFIIFMCDRYDLYDLSDLCDLYDLYDFYDLYDREPQLVPSSASLQSALKINRSPTLSFAIGNIVRIPSLLWRLDFQYVVNCRVANGPEEGMKTARDVRLHIKCRSDGLETEFPGHPRCLIWCGLHFVRSSRFSEFLCG